ncbi:hypothetical protein C8R48DRAFT_673144 [Suillus tomentosus]|nr:hypothetical protein C8R48DRAFT_679776 [Suillus tomentosus]KAG1862320.1 hypothetical protein C8R48DRAFT_673144 [Suillus tomentosus]
MAGRSDFLFDVPGDTICVRSRESKQSVYITESCKMSATVLIFANLVKYFQREHPLYVLRTRGFEPGQPFFTSMDEIVYTYAAAIQMTRPTGPYAISGQSDESNSSV